MYKKKIITVLLCLLSYGIYAQVGVATTTTQIEVPKQTAVEGTNPLSKDKVYMEISLNVAGDLRVSDVPNAMVKEDVKKYTQKIVGDKLEYESTTVTQEVLKTEDYGSVLVAEQNGIVNHIDINKFYAFDLHFTRYVTVTATFDPVKNNSKDGQLVKDTEVTFSWLDFCVQYVHGVGSGELFLDIKFRPNRENLDSAGNQKKFIVVSEMYHESVAGLAYTIKPVKPVVVDTRAGANLKKEDMRRWYYFGDLSQSTMIQGRIGTDEGAGTKLFRSTFFTDDLTKVLMIDIYASTHTAKDGSRYVTVTYWVANPKN